jgi:hypothetical protein
MLMANEITAPDATRSFCLCAAYRWRVTGDCFRYIGYGSTRGRGVGRGSTECLRRWT